MRRTAGAMSGGKAALKDVVEWMLAACKRLGGIVVLVVDVQVVVLHGIAHIVGEQIVVDEGLCGFRCELHHHSCRGVGIHVGVFAGDIIVLDVDDVEEDIARLGLSGNAALVAVGNILLRNILARTLHEFHFNGVLNVLHTHLRLSAESNVVGDLLNELLVLTLLGVEHGLTYGGHYFLFIEADDTPVALQYCLDH